MNYKVYDCFTFFNELDLLEIRLNYLSEVVDYFVLVEADKTHSGEPKPYYYEENKERFKDFHHKIIHIKTILDTTGLTFEKSTFETRHNGSDYWILENAQRNAISDGIVSANDNDIVLIGDLDEIPKREMILDYINNNDTTQKTFILKNHMYFLNYVAYTNIDTVNINWWGTTILRKNNIKTPQGCRDDRYVGGKTTPIFNAGWHFTYMGGVDKVLYKVRSYAHSEYHNDDYLDKEKMLRFVEEGKDFAYNGVGYELVDIKKHKDEYPDYLVNNLHKYKHLMKPILNKKPILVFFIGYSPSIVDNINECGGSEYMAQRLSESLLPYYDVHIFGTSARNSELNGVQYHNSNTLKDFQNNNEIEVLLISRYIYYFLEFPITANKTYIWIHDVYFMPYHDFKPLPSEGRDLILQYDHKITGYVTLTNWHKNFVVNHYGVDRDKVHIIGNAIDTSKWKSDIKKVKNRFIWISRHERGLNNLLRIFPKIQERHPDAELYIYGIYDDEAGFKSNMVHIQSNRGIYYKGAITNVELLEEIQKAEYWFYPTDFAETYCISALEAQMSKTICITSDYAGLSETISDRGILINYNGKVDDGYENNALDELFTLMDDDNLKSKYKELGYEWAKNQTFDNRKDEWLELFNWKQLYIEWCRDMHDMGHIPIEHVDYLKTINYKPKVIYDIGSASLHWTREAKGIWGDVKIYGFDCVEELDWFYKEMGVNYICSVLSDKDNKEVTFYDGKFQIGDASYYQPNPKYDLSVTHRFYPTKRKTRRLDSLVKELNIPLPDMIKIDVQGAELDILKGMGTVLNNVNHIIVELQIEEYNLGATLKDDAIKFIEGLGFELAKGDTEYFHLNSSQCDADYHFRRRVIKPLTNNIIHREQKPILCLFMGYSPFIIKNGDGWGGSELMCKEFAEHMTDRYDVYSFGAPFERLEHTGVKYRPISDLKEFQQSNDIEIMIVVRYIYYFLDFPITAKQTYIWTHDYHFFPYRDFKYLEGNGKYIIDRYDSKITGYIALTNWHKNFISNYYDLDKNKVHVIGNAINPSKWKSDIKKVKNRFIWVSSPDRGLNHLLDIFPTIQSKYPESELYIYGHLVPGYDIKMDVINSNPNIHYIGKRPNEEIISMFQTAEYWVYPTDYYDTFNISALESQMSECIPITSNIGGVAEVVGDRGILIDYIGDELIDYRSTNGVTNDYKERMLSSLFYLMENDNLKNDYIKRGKEWALNQIWTNRINEWLGLFETNKTTNMEHVKGIAKRVLSGKDLTYNIDDYQKQPTKLKSGISVIIPTMYKCDIDNLYYTLGQLNENQLVNQIIIIDNSESKEFERHFIATDKFLVLRPQGNIYTNAAWNLGIKNCESEFYLLLNDDVLVHKKVINFCVRGLRLCDNVGILTANTVNNVGIKEYENLVNGINKPDFMEIEFYSNRKGWFMAGKTSDWVEIPNDLVLYNGDDFLYNYMTYVRNKVNYTIANPVISHFTSSTINKMDVSILKQLEESDESVYNEKYSSMFYGTANKDEIVDKYTFHILGIVYTKTTKEFAPDPFTQQTRLLCKMLTDAGHTVYHYGTEGSDPICTENIAVLSDKTFNEVYGKVDWRRNYFLTQNDNEAIREFNLNAISEINKRKGKNDFLLCPYGSDHLKIANNFLKSMIVVEPDIGYAETFAPYRVFTSYSWMHYVYGLDNTEDDKVYVPSHYDAVIPHSFDVDDYIYSEEKDDYYVFIGRQTELKGLEIAALSVEAVGGKLIVAGQGNPTYESSCIDFVGVIGFEERAKLLSKAKAVFIPTLYTEPFGMVVVESLLSGTPVITTDFGAFPELVIHGKVGYRCRMIEEFVWATKNINKISPKDCREYAINNFSTEVIVKKFEHYFRNLYGLHIGKDWYSLNKGITNLDWLNKTY